MKKKVLLVEDEPLAALELQESLEKAGFDVPAVLDNGDQVIPWVLKNHPDLIVMDVKLRSFNDGIDTATRMKLVSSVPVIFLTAYNTPDIRTRINRLHPQDYLIKPVDETRLVASVRSCFFLDS